jgi:hypothetical protein
MSYKQEYDNDDIEDVKKHVVYEEARWDLYDSDNEEIDSFGQEVQADAEYDTINNTFLLMKEYINTVGVPLCEYMTLHNFVDFVEKI